MPRARVGPTEKGYRYHFFNMAFEGTQAIVSLTVMKEHNPNDEVLYPEKRCEHTVPAFSGGRVYISYQPCDACRPFMGL